MRSGLRIFYSESFWAYGERYINIVGIRGGVERERESIEFCPVKRFL